MRVDLLCFLIFMFHKNAQVNVALRHAVGRPSQCVQYVFTLFFVDAKSYRTEVLDTSFTFLFDARPIILHPLCGFFQESLRFFSVVRRAGIL